MPQERFLVTGALGCIGAWVVRNYEWYIAHMSQFEHASGVSHRVPWKQGILKVAKLVF